MKIALIGGHLSPALALIDAAPADASFVFFGRKYTMEGDKALSLEYRTISAMKIPFLPITTGRLQRNISFRSMISFIKIPYGVRQSLRLLREHRPDVVIGFGGYVSVPVCFAASILRIPVVIHEQTLGIGLANKLIAKLATRICLSWQQSEHYFPKGRTVVTGNPVREWKVEQKTLHVVKGSVPLIYITGGSTGAHAINVLIEGCLEPLLTEFQLVHQTGDSKEFKDYDRLTEARSRLPKKLQDRYIVTKFVPPAEVGSIMRQADFVVSRAGMNTVTELLHFGKPCLLIPLPIGQKQEQLTNAKFLKKTGIGDFCQQAELTPEIFFKKVQTMVANRTKYLVHSQEVKSLVRSDAASRIMKIAYEVARRKK